MRGAELERRLDLAHAFGADADREEPAAAEERDGEAERTAARSQKLNCTSTGCESNGSEKPAPSDTLLEREDADGHRREVERVAAPRCRSA